MGGASCTNCNSSSSGSAACRNAPCQNRPGDDEQMVQAKAADEVVAEGGVVAVESIQALSDGAPVADPLTQDHLVLSALPDKAQVQFVTARSLPELTIPWPRFQELKEAQEAGGRPKFERPRVSDLVVAVSHAWFYQTHPDPLGEKASMVSQLLAEANGVHRPQGSTVVFIDFLSISQRPFASGQASRTAEEQAAFSTALRAMPEIYLHADAILLLEQESAAMVPHDGEKQSVSFADLRQVQMKQFSNTVQVVGDNSNNWCDSQTFLSMSQAKDLPPPTVAPYDFVVSLEGDPVTSIDIAMEKIAGEEFGTGEVKKAPFGKRNNVPATNRGWIYLERFIAMVKVAMAGEAQEDAEKVAFSNSLELIGRIREGGAVLRQAAKAGYEPLGKALEHHFNELQHKSFSATSTDAVTNTGGICGHDAPPVDDAASGDDSGSKRKVVETIMREMVEHLHAHWAEEVRALRQRKLCKAVGKLRFMSRLKTATKRLTQEAVQEAEQEAQQVQPERKSEPSA